jgi:hypothetical protein
MIEEEERTTEEMSAKKALVVLVFGTCFMAVCMGGLAIQTVCRMVPNNRFTRRVSDWINEPFFEVDL